MRACVRACVCACVRVCVHACVCVCMRACMRWRGGGDRQTDRQRHRQTETQTETRSLLCSAPDEPLGCEEGRQPIICKGLEKDNINSTTMGSCSLTHFTVHTFIDTTSSCPLQMFRLSCGPSTSVIVELMNETALPHAMVHTPMKIDTTPRLILWTADFRVTRSQSFRHQAAPDFILSFNSRWLFTRWCPVFCSYHT